MKFPIPARRLATALLLLTGLCGSAFAQNYPSKPVEVMVAFQPGGGTDSLARAYAEAAKKHSTQPLVVYNKPGASGAIGLADVVGAKPDGYKIAMLFVEVTILPHMGITKITQDDFIPIARLNADPAAITVKADSPYNTIEEFLAAARKPGSDIKVGNAGNGSIWHLAAASLEEKSGARFNHIPYQGAGPAVLALLGGHVDAVGVSPAEVGVHVAAGKLKVLGVMADQRIKGFENVPTLKERKIDLSIGTWRGLGVAKGTPPEVVENIRAMTKKAVEEPIMREVMDKLNLGYAYADGPAFKTQMVRDNETFKQLVTKLNFKN
ncbi:MAG TPA: tripartite tricarboxylate transporter substrate binding protein [Polaromonas sp.]|uniref:tripartite tricarboxylate transporter substrate binding protein n=1 Tax=Polaromonas sp. TaxID=1869339 RepID=UPI002D674AE9|nr:tripartite tricarboxylate transporter substrate binding protein [Polaromonas sp.]HYW56818.1 tripartite tricarboxylate transporter substrate binding protein [Polaromonas sp.]